MQQHSDDRLIAYLDGELETAQRRELETWLKVDPDARRRLAALAESAHLLRLAFDEVIHEPVPERLLAAARGETVAAPAGAQILPFRRRTGAERPVLRRWVGLPLAASLFGLLIGGSVAYLGVDKATLGGAGGKQTGLEASAANNVWLDNAAGYFKLVVSAGDSPPVDVPASGDPREALQKISQSLPQEVRLPDLKPWGLSFRGARLVVAEGRPAAELVYTTDNKAIGPLTLIIGSSKQPDISPTFDPARRQLVVLAAPGARLRARRPG
jgi:anti-sigma factor RsiW